MGLIHSGARKRRDNAEARLLQAQVQQAKWDPIVAAFEAGEATWDGLSRWQKLNMPIRYQLLCKAAEKRRAAP